MNIQEMLNLVNLTPTKKNRGQSIELTQYPLATKKYHIQDSNIFKQFVQEKIKEKYQETKTRKLSSTNKCKTIQVETELQRRMNEKHNKILHTEEIERRFHPEDKIKIPRSSMHKQDSLQKFINKKEKQFLRTSNLLVPSFNSSFNEKQGLKSSIGKLKVNQCSSHELRKNYIDIHLRQRISNYGYEMDGSIYNFEENRRSSKDNTETKEIISHTEQLKTKKDIYKYLRDTSPLKIQRTIMKNQRTTNPSNKKHQKFKDKRISFKKAKKIVSKHIQPSKKYKMVPSQFSYPQSIYLQSNQEGICGWEYQQEH